MSSITRRPEAFAWEFLQNLPIVAGFVGAARSWEPLGPPAAAGCAVAGGVSGALLIALTERRIVPGHRETARQAIGNATAFSAASLGLAAYLAGAAWGQLGFDLAIGALAGLTLNAVQEGLRKLLTMHGLAMAGATAVGLAVLRLLMALPALAVILLVTTLLSIIMTLVDYGGHPRESQESALQPIAQDGFRGEQAGSSPQEEEHG